MQKAEHLLFSQMLSFTVPFFSEWCSFRWKFANRNSDTHWIPEFLVGAGGFASRAEKEPESRLPAAASCLGRHAHPAGRSPNSSSLFLPQAAVVAVAQGLFTRRTIRRGLRVALAAFSAAPWQGFEKAERCPSLASLFPPQAAVGSAAVRIHPLYKFKLVAKQKPQRTCIR